MNKNTCEYCKNGEKHEEGAIYPCTTPQNIHVSCLGIPGCEHLIGDKCDCTCHTAPEWEKRKIGESVLICDGRHTGKVGIVAGRKGTSVAVRIPNFQGHDCDGMCHGDGTYEPDHALLPFESKNKKVIDLLVLHLKSAEEAHQDGLSEGLKLHDGGCINSRKATIEDIKEYVLQKIQGPHTCDTWCKEDKYACAEVEEIQDRIDAVIREIYGYLSAIK